MVWEGGAARLLPIPIMRLKSLMSRAMKIMKWAAISTAVLLLLLVLFWKPILRFAFHDLPFMGRSFDRTVWTSALSCKNDRDCLDKEMACLRGPMYRDLERNHLVVGLPKTTVTGLIGEPTVKSNLRCFGRFSKTRRTLTH